MNDPTLPVLINVSLRSPRPYELVTPCCHASPDLLGGLLLCPCGKSYGLGELVRQEAK